MPLLYGRLYYRLQHGRNIPEAYIQHSLRLLHSRVYVPSTLLQDVPLPHVPRRTQEILEVLIPCSIRLTYGQTRG